MLFRNDRFWKLPQNLMKSKRETDYKDMCIEKNIRTYTKRDKLACSRYTLWFKKTISILAVY